MTDRNDETAPALAEETPIDDADALVEPDVPESSPGDALRSKTGGSKKRPSDISGVRVRKRDLVRIDTLRPSLADRIRADFPDLPPGAKISRAELARYRVLYVEEILKQEHGDVTELDQRVAESIARQDTIAENSEETYDEDRTIGERLSDHLASFGGSWAFLISFGMVLAVWIAINLFEGDTKAFDPYPFILLNLILSCLAAVQAPIIMMSQKRQEAKDRIRSLNDYSVNLKAELEIRHLHEKIDFMISRQWQNLAEIQQMQLEIMQEGQIQMKSKPAKSSPPPAAAGK